MDIEITRLSARLESLETYNKNLNTVLAEQDAALQATLAAQEAALSAAFIFERAQNQRERRRLRCQAGLAFVALVGVIFLSPANRQAIAHAQGAVFPAIFARLNALEAKTQFQSVDPVAKSTTFSGCNLIVNDGGGKTSTIVRNDAGQGLGNLIIGYNETGNFLGDGDIRTGSHNLILGQHNNYSSFGGMVAGNSNAISGAFASVIEGEANQASGLFAIVTEGKFNQASNAFAAITAGERNTASGVFASVTGGDANTASQIYSAVSGGIRNIASGASSSVSGGNNNTASGSISSISGGDSNVASKELATVSGGQNITQDNFFGWSAGDFHTP